MNDMTLKHFDGHSQVCFDGSNVSKVAVEAYKVSSV